MVTHFYYLKDIIQEELVRIEDDYLNETAELHIEFIDPHNEETPYYQVTIVTFTGTRWVV